SHGLVSRLHLVQKFAWQGCESQYFFFQAEDGIRDDLVTGVQTCALPISAIASRPTSSSSCVRATPVCRASSSCASSFARSVIVFGVTRSRGRLRSRSRTVSLPNAAITLPLAVQWTGVRRPSQFTLKIGRA